MDENEIIDYVNKSKQYTAFEVTPTSRDFAVGDTWGFDINDYQAWSENEVYDKGSIVKHNG